MVGLPDERLGEIPAAAVRLSEGATLASANLEAWVKERLADYKVPKRWLEVDDFPRTGTVKVRRASLAALFD